MVHLLVFPGTKCGQSFSTFGHLAPACTLPGSSFTFAFRLFQVCCFLYQFFSPSIAQEGSSSITFHPTWPVSPACPIHSAHTTQPVSINGVALLTAQNNNNNNNKTWILFAMSAYSIDKLKFTSAREKKEENKEKIISKTPKFTVHNPHEHHISPD